MKSNIKTISYDNTKKVVFIILLLFSIHFWDLRFIPQKFNLENLITWMVCLFSFIMIIKKNNLRFRNAILLFIIGLIFNVFAAYINLGQSPKQTILSFGYYYFILMYFLLHYFELDRKFLENIIIVFAILYSAVFIIQYLVYPFEIIKRAASTARLEIQPEIIGHGFLLLAYFLILNRYFINRRLINIILALGFFLVLFKSGFRTLIFGAAMVTVLMVIRMFRFSLKDLAIVIFAALLFIGLIQFRGIAETIDGMINKTKNEIRLGNRYIRRVEIEFFFKKYPENISYFFIGGGKVSGKGLYHYNPKVLGMNYNIVWVDIGLLGFYIVVGGIATLGLLWYTLKAIFFKLPRDRLYLSCYFLYLLLVSITNEEIYRNGIFSVQAIGLYLIDIAANERLESANETPVLETRFSANT
jgi:hypothetical protein